MALLAHRRPASELGNAGGVSGLILAELPVTVVERAPEIPARNRAVRAPLRADLAHVFRRWSLPLPVRAANRVLNPQVELRENVAAAEAKHQEHLRRPAANAFDLHEVLDEIVVVHLVHRIEWQRAAHDFGRKIPQVADLLARQSDCSKLLIRCREHGVRFRCAAEQRVEARQNRPGCFPGQLLVDDRANERLIMRTVSSQLDPARTDGLDYLGEDRIDTFEVSDGCAIVCHPVNLRVPRARRARRACSFLR